MNWQKFNKLWAALAGLALLFFMEQTGIHIPGISQAVAELILSVLTAWGVFQLPNKPDGPDGSDGFRGV